MLPAGVDGGAASLTLPGLLSTLKWMYLVRYFPKQTMLCILFLVLIFTAMSLGADGSLLEYFEGEVTVNRNGEEFFADFGEPLEAGDLVVTGLNSIAVLRLNESSKVKMREDTQLQIDGGEQTAAVTLKTGGVFAKISRSLQTIGRRVRGFEVKTPTVVAGVRGTEFFIAYGRTVEEKPDIWLCVNEGSVQVTVQQTKEAVTVDEGEGINILGGLRATEPRFFPWTQELNWNFDPDAGDVFDDTDLEGAYADLLDQDYD